MMCYSKDRNLSLVAGYLQGNLLSGAGQGMEVTAMDVYNKAGWNIMKRIKNESACFRCRLLVFVLDLRFVSSNL